MRPIHIDQSITLRDEHSLLLYLGELDSIELISAQEEVLLARKIKAGDQAALQKLVRANLRFVVSCAKKYQRLGLPLNDLVNEGNLGLIRAARTFDETKGFKFISYAVWWIRQSMMMALSTNARMIRLPGNMVRATADIRKMADVLEQRLERVPTEQELQQELCCATDAYLMEYAFGRTVVSLDEEVKQDGQDQLWSMVREENLPQTDEPLMEQDLCSSIARLLEVLNERERKVLLEFFGFGSQVPRTLEDIAHDLGISRERARQLKSNALEKLKAMTQGKAYLYL